MSAVQLPARPRRSRRPLRLAPAPAADVRAMLLEAAYRLHATKPVRRPWRAG